MKTNRILPLFFALLLTVTLLVPAAAAEEGDAPVLPAPPELNCQAALLVDYNTGSIVYAKNEHQEMYPASLTKIMTALLVLEAVDAGQLSLGQELTASRAAMTAGLTDDGSTAGIQVGEVMTVEEYLTCMLVVSANEACNVLAEAVSGSVDAFVDAMNARAEALGCENTHFVNPTGLHDPQHYTTAWDMYLMTRAAMEHSDFMRICDTGTAHIPATNLSEERTLHTTNYLIDGWRSLGYRNSDAHGIKTGSTDAAGHCLVSSAMKGSLHFLSVVLGGERLTLEDGEIRTYSFYDTNLLFDWALDNFSYQTVILEEEEIQEVPVLLSDIDHVTVHPAADTEALLPTVLSPEESGAVRGAPGVRGGPGRRRAEAGHPDTQLRRRGLCHRGPAGQLRRGGQPPPGPAAQHPGLPPEARGEDRGDHPDPAGDPAAGVAVLLRPPPVPVRPQRHPPAAEHLPGPPALIPVHKKPWDCGRSPTVFQFWSRHSFRSSSSAQRRRRSRS